MKCESCGTLNPPSAKYCLDCGSKLSEQTDPKGSPKRVVLGDYEVMDYDNEPDEYTLPEIDQDGPVIDRDTPFVSDSLDLKHLAKPARNLILFALLVLIATLSYYGVNAVGKNRQDQKSEILRETALKEEERIKAEREGYLKKYREFIILSQAQFTDFETNLIELTKLESNRWLTKIFLGGLFDRMAENYRQTDTFTAMISRSAHLKDAVKALEDPPKGLDDLYSKAQAVYRAQGKVAAVFTGELTETTAEAVKENLDGYETSLKDAQSAL